LTSWDELCGDRTLRRFVPSVRHPFNADANGVAFELVNGTIGHESVALSVFIFEDPDDGYRSVAAPLLTFSVPLWELGLRGLEPLDVPVHISLWADGDEDQYEGLVFTDRRNGRVILRVGTCVTDSYYPYFLSEWTPENLAEPARG
jgi:hypothetical protein